MALKDVIGQEDALGILRKALSRRRLASSYLFAGQQGTGKRFTALNLAKALNCLRPVDGDACDTCHSCMTISAGTHPDFILIEPNGAQIKVEAIEDLEEDVDTQAPPRKLRTIKVDAIRGLEEALSLRPYGGGIKVAVVDDAETMNQNAANAFLKTLEEPPGGSIIILVSSSPDMLPLTIRSRCLRVNFAPLSPPACREVLERAGVPEPERLARLSMGRPGLAVKEDLLNLRNGFIETLGKAAVPWKDGVEMQMWLDFSLLLLRDMAALKITGDSGGLINRDIAAKVEAMSRNAAEKVIIDCYGKLLTLRNSVRFNLNKGITWNYANAVLGQLNLPAGHKDEAERP